MRLQAGPRIDFASAPLTYSIADCSAHSGRYVAENILIDKPADQASRWSGAHQGNVKQWILLELESPAVLKSITFGKYSKHHPCNMKEFKIYVGMSREHMTEVLHSGLKNDIVPETFPIKSVNDAGVCFPTRFVKIEPISAHGQSYHTSIWHVAMSGITDETFVEHVRIAYDEYRETAVLRHVLKYLRQRRLLTPYQSVLSRSGLQVEHPLITDLHESIVLQGDWPKVEAIISAISKEGLFDSFLHGSQPHAIWKRLFGTDADGDVPSPRGGHAMCIDPINDVIYLFGGWDGQKSLDDFWAYHVKEDRWRVLSHSTSTQQNAPGARSCHKMVFDTKTGSIYLLGRLSDSDTSKATTSAGQTQTPQSGTEESTKAYCSEFYRYHTRGVDTGKWDFLSFDTASSGGPPLMFDHQMVMDSDAQVLYVFGGRVIDGDWDNPKYSGLYSYSVRTSKWALLQTLDEQNRSQITIPPRFGHSMVFDPLSRTLYIFAGQRNDKYLSDMYAYDIATNIATKLFSNFTAASGPDPCYTQRAVIDPDLHEIYVFCGLTRSPQAGSTASLSAESPNWLFSYRQSPGKWSQILPEPFHSASSRSVQLDPSTTPREDPLPRYAHQVVYNHRTKTFFLHGGNAGVVEHMERRQGCHGNVEEGNREAGKEQRLDDLWRMKLMRAEPEDVTRKATYRVRQQQFREMCEDADPISALNFLQTKVSAVVNHQDSNETERFRSLLTYLLSPGPASSDPVLEPGDHPVLDMEVEPQRDSRSSTPEGGRWTSEIHTDDDASYSQSSEDRTVSAEGLRQIEDPVEHTVRSEGKVSSARFKERNEVFEDLLQFVSEGEKQPNESLLDMIGAELAAGL